jgi:CXXX repeat radical SAM target protein
MNEKNKQEEIQTRREFFKKAAKSALPVLSAAVLSSVPFLKAEAQYGCGYGCSYSCDLSCDDSCYRSCSGGCDRHCKNDCSSGCDSTCTKECNYACKAMGAVGGIIPTHTPWEYY